MLSWLVPVLQETFTALRIVLRCHSKSTCSGEFLIADDSAAPRRLGGQLIVDWASLTLTDWLAKAEHHREGEGPDDLIRGEAIIPGF